MQSLRDFLLSLNESPSKKEGKFQSNHCEPQTQPLASMKALPKRKGNSVMPRAA